MRFTKMRGLFALCAGGLCFAAFAGADDAAKKSNTRTETPATAATPYIVDRSPMATSAEQQATGYAEATSAVGDYTGSTPPSLLLMTRVGMAGGQGAAQAGVLNADTLSRSIDKFQQAFLNPETVPEEAGKGVVKQFFLFVHNSFYNQHTFDNGILEGVFTKSLGILRPLTTLEKQRALQAAPNVPPVNQDVEAQIARREKARFDAASTYLLEQYAKFAYPLKNDVLALEQQSRFLDKQNYSTTRLTYSNADLRTDVIGQYQTGTDNGYGAGLRFALDGYSPPPDPMAKGVHAPPALIAYSTGKVISPDLIVGLQSENFTAEAGQRLVDAANDAVRQVPLTLARYLLKPHFGLAANVQHFNGVGNYYDAGANASALMPLRMGNHQRAFFYGASLRYQWFEAEAGANANAGLNFLSVRAAQISSGGSRKGIGGSLVFAFQDNAPFIDGKFARLGRWHLRAGVEYAPQNALVSHDYGALFLRLRDRGAGEYTFLLGSEVNGQAFVGFNISVYFGGPKRQKVPAPIPL